MPTPEEVQARADFAWKKVTRRRTILDSVTGEGPMPAAIALDYVQEVLDDRDDCVTALLWAAGRWLEAKMPAGDLQNCRVDAYGLIGDLKSEYFQHAEAMCESIWFRCEDIRQTRPYPSATNWEHFDRAGDWQFWTESAGVAVGFAREICAAAHPEPA